MSDERIQLPSHMVDKLLENTGWDYAVIQMNMRPPMALERAVCTVKKDGENIVLHVDNGPHPIRENARASAVHFIPIKEITGVSYYTEAKIVAGKGKILASV